MKQTLLGGAMTVCVSVLVTACGLLAYDRLVVRPAQVIGVVDVAEIYRLKEAEFAALMTAATRTRTGSRPWTWRPASRGGCPGHSRNCPRTVAASWC
jgi:hypothetical protein